MRTWIWTFSITACPGCTSRPRGRGGINDEAPPEEPKDYAQALLAVLGRWNVCSKEYVVRQYDHEVQAGSVVKPLTGAQNDGPSDAAVIRPDLSSLEGVVVSHGICPKYSRYDTYDMAACAIDEAIRNNIASGGSLDRMAVLDNFCWCDPVRVRKEPGRGVQAGPAREGEQGPPRLYGALRHALHLRQRQHEKRLRERRREDLDPAHPPYLRHLTDKRRETGGYHRFQAGRGPDYPARKDLCRACGVGILRRVGLERQYLRPGWTARRP